MNALVHQLADCLRFIGMRDRLRCPCCKAVGTWKPHGGWFDKEDERKVRRWMCKWCGSYIGPEGRRRVEVGSNCWILIEETFRVQPDNTPLVAVRDWFDRSVSPWAG